MGKPSLTKSSAPKTPPQTVWDLNDLTQNTTYYAVHTAAPDEYAALLAQVNTAPVIEGIVGAGLMEDAAEVTALLGDYDYVFLGTNGGSDETVTARDDLNGIIVTGDGKDHVFGSGNAEVILTGNGTDDAHGAAGDDIIFGENGQDSLYGDAGNDWLFGGNGPDTLVGGTDDGTFSLTDGALTLNEDLKIFDGDLGVVDGEGHFVGKGGTIYQDSSENLQFEGYYSAGGHFYEVFNFSPKDYPVEEVNDQQDFAVVLYSDDYSTELGHFDIADLFEIKSYNFGIDLSFYQEGGHVVVFKGLYADLTPEQVAEPQGNWLHQIHFAALDDVTSGGEPALSFEAGDVLTGGAGPDNFVYHDGDGVDEVTDYSRDDGDVVTLDAVLQGDVDVLHQDGDSYIVFGDGKGGYLADAAIKITGVGDFDVSEIVFG